MNIDITVAGLIIWVYAMAVWKAKAYVKACIAAIVEAEKKEQGSYVILLTGDGRVISKVRVLGRVVEVSDLGRRIDLVLDDGTGTLLVRVWEDKRWMVEDVVEGDYVDVFARVRSFRDTLYLSPDIVVKASEEMLEVRRLELEVLERLGVALTHNYPPDTGGTSATSSPGFSL